MRRTLALISALALVPLLAQGATLSPQAGLEQPVAADAEAIMLRLRNGSIRWGAIEDHDPDGIRFSLLSHGGRVRVPWNFIDPVQELEMRTRYGYVDVSSEELMIDAEQLTLKNGDEVVGVITSRQGEHFVVKAAGHVSQIPKANVASVQSGLRVPALEVYTREEIYGQYLADLDPESPESQWELAQTCERILDFAHAAEHYQAIPLLDPTFRDEAVRLALEKALVKAEQQEQIDYLRQVDQLRRKGLYDRAEAHCVAFRELYPDSPLLEDANKKQVKVQEARDRAAVELVNREWKRWLGRLAREAAKTKTYAEVVAYAEEVMSQDIQAKVLESLHKKISPDLTGEHVRAYWSKRRKVRYDKASYGHGTWLLGDEGATKGMEKKGQTDAAPPGATDAARKKLEDKIKKFLANQERARKARSREDESEDQETFWRSFSVNNRAQWIRAYHIEYGGDFDVREKPQIAGCSECGGKGVREIIYIGGGGGGNDNSRGGRGGRGGRRNNNQAHPGSSLVSCPTCHGIGAVRKIYYR